MRLVITAAAERDLIEAITFIAADNPEAAMRLRDRLLEQADRLLKFPELGRPLPRGIRALVVSQTPFRLIYHTGPESLTVLRIWHGARRWSDIAD